MTEDFYNANGVTCDVIQDLMPLIADGVASEDSGRLLTLHLEHCGECRDLFDKICSAKTVPNVNAATDDKKIMSYIRKRYVLFVTFIMMIGAAVGVLFIDTEFLFQNLLIMPLVGVLSYVCFKGKGAIMAGVVMLLSIFRGAVFWLSAQPDMAGGSAQMGLIMAMLVMMGFVAAWLLAFAFRAENKDSKTKKGKEENEK